MRTHPIRFGAIPAALFAVAGLAGCADFERATAAWGPAALNVESPVAPAVQAAQTQPMGFPSFRSVPPALAAVDQRTPLQWSRTVQGLNREAGQLTTWAQENPSLAPTTTAAFNDSALKELKYNAADAPPVDQATQSEAFANSLRTQAAPPPAPK